MDVATLIFFCFGLVIGSFLNVVVIRLEKNESLNGRSRCPGCGATIAWYDNIPLLSFVFLRGKCRQCKMPIAWQYPAVELLTGLTFAVLGTLTFDAAGSLVSHLLTMLTLFLAGLFITISVYDLRTMEIPLIFLVIGAIAAALMVILSAFEHGGQPFAWGHPGLDMLLGASVAIAFFYALVFFSKETWMGMGDVWLAGIAGALVGLSSLLFFLTLSFFLGALTGGLLLLLGKKGMKSHIPFAPFLACGALVTLVLQHLMPSWFHLFLSPYV